MSGAQSASMLRSVYDSYTKLRNSDVTSWPDLKLVAVRAAREIDAGNKRVRLSAEEAWNRANGRVRSGVEGWVRHRSLVYELGGSELPIPPVVGDAEAGPPIAGEWSIGPAESVHLRPAPEADLGCFAEWYYSERSLVDADLRDDEIPALCQEVSILHQRSRAGSDTPAARKFDTLLYRIYWGYSDDSDPGALRRLFARFAGFQARGNIIKLGAG